MNPPHALHGEGEQPQAGGGVARARQLRRQMSLPEVMLWQRLRGRTDGVKFRRQHPLGPYVLDFYGARGKLAVEIDGATHDRGDRPARDSKRDAFIVQRGLRLIRIAATDVLRDADAVADALVRVAIPLHRPAGGPPPHAPHGEDLRGAA